MKIASFALALLLLAQASAVAEDIPMCSEGQRPSHKSCTRVTDGPRFGGGYLFDCRNRKLCKLSDGFRPGAIILRSKPSQTPSRQTSSPSQLGRKCITQQKDGRKTFIINKCSFDLNIKWNDKICRSTLIEHYPCTLSIKSNNRVTRKHLVHDTVRRGMGTETTTVPLTYQTFPDFGPARSVACKSPLFPYEGTRGKLTPYRG